MTAPAVTELPRAERRRGPIRLTCAVNELRDALAWVAWAIPRRPPMQTLKGVRLTVDRGVLTLSATDYSVQATATVNVPGGRGHALVSGETLTAIVRALPTGSGISLHAQGGTLTITGGTEAGPISYNVPLMDPDDYPADMIRGTSAISMSGLNLSHLARTVIAAGRDDTLPVLTCVHLELDETGVTAAATDRYRLAVATWSVEEGAPTGAASVVDVPAVVLSRAAQAMRKDRFVVMYWEDESETIMFESGGRTLAARTYGGEFPKWRTLMRPEDTTATIRAERPALLDALTAVEAVSHRYSPFRLNLTPGQLTTLTTNHDVEKVHPDDLTASAVVHGLTHQGIDEPVILGFNPRFFRDGLCAVTGPDLVLAFDKPTRPLYIRAQDDTAFTYLLMPVRLPL